VFSAEKGCIVETTEIGEGQGKVTKISVESDGGNRYIVIRKRGGGLFNYFTLTFIQNLPIEKCLYTSRLHSLARILRSSKMSGTLENLGAK